MLTVQGNEIERKESLTFRGRKTGPEMIAREVEELFLQPENAIAWRNQ